MKKLLQYLGNYKKESILGPLFKLLEASFELIVPLVMAAIIDTGVANADRPYIMKMSLVLFLLAPIGRSSGILLIFQRSVPASPHPGAQSCHAFVQRHPGSEIADAPAASLRSVPAGVPAVPASAGRNSGAGVPVHAPSDMPVPVRMSYAIYLS